MSSKRKPKPKKNLNKDKYQIGRFMAPKHNNTGVTHIVDATTKSPICNCPVKHNAQFHWVAFGVDLKQLDCSICKQIWKAWVRDQWRRYR